MIYLLKGMHPTSKGFQINSLYSEQLTDLSQVYMLDYFEYIKLYQKKKISSRQDIFRLFGIIQQGAFLNEVNYEWLDRFKSRITDFIIDSFTYFAEADIHVTKELDLALIS